MSKTMNDICERARRVGMDPDEWLDREIEMRREIARLEREEMEFFAGVRTCGRCGHDSIPEVIGGYDGVIEVCPECRCVDSFERETGRGEK